MGGSDAEAAGERFNEAGGPSALTARAEAKARNGRPPACRLWAATVVLAACLWPGSADTAGLETKAGQAFMIEAGSGTILLAKDADAPVQPASLAKLMTAEVVFDALATGKARLDDTYRISEHAWRTGGAPSRTPTMFAALKSEVRLEDLLKGVIVHTANDGAIAIAEGMAGSEAAFAELMNARARAIGLKASKFRNPTGAAAEGQVVTMRELALLAAHLRDTYREHYKLYALPEFSWNKITQRNKNPLLGAVPGVDGLVSGGTAETGGFSFVGSAQRGDQRLYLALGGLPTDRERVAEARRLIEWGMSAFDRAPLFAKDAVVGQARVYGGASPTVPLKATGAVAILLPVEGKERLSARIVYHGPVTAPVKAGTPIGSLKVWVGDTLSQETPLFAAEDVVTGSVAQRAADALGELAFGWLR